MENSNPKLNTILLVILVVLAAACLVVLLTQRTGRGMADQDRFSDMNYSGQNQNMQNGMTAGSSQMQTPPVGQNQVQAGASGTKPGSQMLYEVFSTKGISVSVPAAVGYISNTTAPRALGNLPFLAVSYNNKNVVTITKFLDSRMFTDATPQAGSDWALLNANYVFSGLPAKKYTRNGEYLVVVPSKLVLVEISSAAFTGISQQTLDQIVASVQLP